MAGTIQRKLCIHDEIYLTSDWFLNSFKLLSSTYTTVSATMERLPAELLIAIAESLADIDHSSLQYFVLVSQRFYQAGTPYLFSTVALLVGFRQLVPYVVERFPNAVKPHVRHLVVTEREKEICAGETGLWGTLSTDILQQFGHPRPKSNGSPDDDGTDDGYSERLYEHSEEQFDGKPDEQMLDYEAPQRHYSNAEYVPPWHHLIYLLAQLPNFRSITWEVDEPFPESLLAVLRTHRAGSEIHMKANRCPLWALERSAILSSLSQSFDDTAPTVILNELMARFIRELPPSLKSLRVERGNAHRPEEFNKIYYAKPAASIPPKPDSEIKLALNHLDISLYIESLDFWKRATDFLVLKRLTLNGHLRLNNLKCLTNDCTFRSLNSLWLDLTLPLPYNRQADPYLDTYSIAVIEEYVDLAKTLFEHLADSGVMLSALGLCSIFPPAVFTAVMKHHGQFLSLLNLHQPGRKDTYQWKATQIKLINQSCPILEELMIRIARTEGDQSEVAIYKTLGTFIKLRRLHLALDIREGLFWSEDMTSWENRTYSNDEPAPWEPDLCRRLLINSNVDGALAQSIFRTINSAKPVGAPLLAILTTCFAGAPVLWYSDHPLQSSDDYQFMMILLMRDWIIRPHPNIDLPNELIVDENKASYWHLDQIDSSWDFIKTWTFTANEMSVIKALWPERLDHDYFGPKEGPHDWWHYSPSKPLAL
ncbi:hypothetical protein BT63DRAFT_452740 [Microthyrium microscopicum]|uniref:F-box domain-containing protein n=1 Tax=Microthyrium microscopicum TaxID=703497 RepID=A0A6A6UKI3_9PEZI|nr:hypothetical protein BT63DRAFT_452740 [Microthyrium microscopicum]